MQQLILVLLLSPRMLIDRLQTQHNITFDESYSFNDTKTRGTTTAAIFNLPHIPYNCQCVFGVSVTYRLEVRTKQSMNRR